MLTHAGATLAEELLSGEATRHEQRRPGAER